MTLLDRLQQLEEFSFYRHNLSMTSHRLEGRNDDVEMITLMVAACISPDLFRELLEAAGYWSEGATNQNAVISGFMMGFALGRSSGPNKEMQLSD